MDIGRNGMEKAFFPIASSGHCDSVNLILLYGFNFVSISKEFYLYFLTRIISQDLTIFIHKRSLIEPDLAKGPHKCRLHFVRLGMRPIPPLYMTSKFRLFLLSVAVATFILVSRSQKYQYHEQSNQTMDVPDMDMKGKP
ncbi:hypothetical protein VNO77_35809 [Canavalia gladiata]|uniref:Transmembrane protein n=1 Tax=Canavalia gladiata TaxID=3824 RepID=A0AAN9PXB7_CANGL